MSLTCPSKWRCSVSAVLWLSLPAMDILLWLVCCWHNGERLVNKHKLQLRKLKHQHDCSKAKFKTRRLPARPQQQLALRGLSQFCGYCQVVQEVHGTGSTRNDFCFLTNYDSACRVSKPRQRRWVSFSGLLSQCREPERVKRRKNSRRKREHCADLGKICFCWNITW